MSGTPCLLVENEAALQAAIQEIAHPVVGLDTETTGLDPLSSRVRLIQFAIPGKNFVIDLFKVRAISNPQIRRVLESSETVKVLHNAKFDVKMLLRHFNVELRGIFDTLLASQLIGAGRIDIGHGLAAVADRHLSQEVDKSAQASDWSGALTQAQYEYAAKDAELMLPLRETLAVQIDELGLNEVAKLEF